MKEMLTTGYNYLYLSSFISATPLPLRIAIPQLRQERFAVSCEKWVASRPVCFRRRARQANTGNHFISDTRHSELPEKWYDPLPLHLIMIPDIWETSSRTIMVAGLRRRNTEGKATSFNYKAKSFTSQ